MTLFQDFVQGPGASAAAVANKVALSDLTLPQSARMITRIWATHALQGTYAANKPSAGYVIVDSEDCGIKPFHIPLEPIAGYTTLGSGAVAPATKWITNTPCPGGSVLSFDVVGDVAPNAATEIQVVVEFSDGASPFGSGQLHQKAAEPAVTLSTSDNGAVSMTDIEIKAAALNLVWAYAVYTTAIADTSVIATCEVTSDDFAVAGPHKFSLNPQGGGDANTVGATPFLTKIPQDIAFRAPMQKQTLSCVGTMRDALTTGPLANWGVVYQ